MPGGFFLLLSADSALIRKVDALAASIASSRKDEKYSAWMALIASLIGGMLVLLGQSLDSWRKRRQEKKKDLRSTYYSCEEQVAYLKNLLNELATGRNLEEFWWHAYKKELSATTPNKEDANNCYSKSVAESENSIKCEIKIGETFAKYYALAVKFTTLSKNKPDISFIPQMITANKFHPAKRIDLSVSSDDALKEYHAARHKTVNTYLKILIPLEILNNDFKKQICKMDYNFSMPHPPSPKPLPHPPKPHG